MIRISTIVGARPQFIKASAVSRVIQTQYSNSIQESIIHTGQHHDANMSSIFFEELGIPNPVVNLGVAGMSHGAMTGQMLEAIEATLSEGRPDLVLVYGDTNSTLAACLAAAKMNIPIAHVEAGLRSFNRRMPEEINRITADHLSTYLFCPSRGAEQNLLKEGISEGVFISGDVMCDVLFKTIHDIQCQDDLTPLPSWKDHILVTIHRAENTDDGHRLSEIISALRELKYPILLPLHPRTRAALEKNNLQLSSNVNIIEPLGHRELIAALSGARAVITDSGGLQKEAYWLSIPCVTIRDQTEWIETVEMKWNILSQADSASIVNAVNDFQRPESHPILYGGDGKAAARICAELASVLSA
jgi:UDP-GlcNAc3NAcA epimerase